MKMLYKAQCIRCEKLFLYVHEEGVYDTPKCNSCNELLNKNSVPILRITEETLEYLSKKGDFNNSYVKKRNRIPKLTLKKDKVIQ